MSVKPLTAEDLRRVACPVCHQALQLEDDAIQCSGCHRRYPIVDGIPVLQAGRALSM